MPFSGLWALHTYEQSKYVCIKCFSKSVKKCECFWSCVCPLSLASHIISPIHLSWQTRRGTLILLRWVSWLVCLWGYYFLDVAVFCLWTLHLRSPCQQITLPWGVWKSVLRNSCCPGGLAFLRLHTDLTSPRYHDKKLWFWWSRSEKTQVSYLVTSSKSCTQPGLPFRGWWSGSAPFPCWLEEGVDVY